MQALRRESVLPLDKAIDGFADQKKHPQQRQYFWPKFLSVLFQHERKNTTSQTTATSAAAAAALDSKIQPSMRKTKLTNKQRPNSSALVIPNQPRIFDILVLGERGSGAHAFASNFAGEKLDEQFSARRVIKCKDSYATTRVTVFYDVRDVPCELMARACGAIIMLGEDEASNVKRAAGMRKELVRAKRGKFCCCVLVASKQDGIASGGRALVSKAELKAWGEESGFEHSFAASALTGWNVQEAFAFVHERAASAAENSRRGEGKRAHALRWLA